MVGWIGFAWLELGGGGGACVQKTAWLQKSTRKGENPDGDFKKAGCPFAENTISQLDTVLSRYIPLGQQRWSKAINQKHRRPELLMSTSAMCFCYPRAHLIQSLPHGIQRRFAKLAGLA